MFYAKHQTRLTTASAIANFMPRGITDKLENLVLSLIKYDLAGVPPIAFYHIRRGSTRICDVGALARQGINLAR